MEQLGADLVLELRDPGGALVVRVDSPNGTQGLEELVAVAERPGRHRLVLIFTAPSGATPYRVVETERRPATAADRALVAADREYREGRALASAGRPAEAVEKFRSALATFERQALPTRQAAALFGLCDALQFVESKSVAIAFCDRAAELFRHQPDRMFLADTLVAAGFLRTQLGQPEQASRALEEARPIYEALGSKEGATLAAGKLIAAYQAQGRLQAAIGVFEDALQTRLETREAAVGASFDVDSAALMLALNRPREALNLYQQALAAYRELKEVTLTAIALRGVGRAAIQTGDLDLAKQVIEEGLSLLPQGAEPGARIALLTTLGSLLRQRGELERGRQVLDQALRLARSAKEVQREATALLELGYLEVAAQRPREGLSLMDEALAKFAAIPDARGTAAARVRSAEALRDLGRLEEAWQRLEPALLAVEGLRTETERRDFRARYFAFRQDYYEIAIDLLMRLDERDPARGFARRALAVHERRLARELRDARVRAQAETRVEEEGTLTSERKALESRLRALVLALPGEAVEHEIDEVLSRLEQVDARVHSATEASLPSGEPAGLDLAAAQRTLLDPGSVLLVFSLGETRSFLWVVTRDDLRAHVLPGRREIESVARAFSARIRSPRQDRAELRASWGRRLSELLLAPAAPELRSRRLLIVPQGVLQAIPWAALPEPGETSGSEADHYLVERHEIVLLPSLGTLADLRRQPKRATRGSVAVFADPVYQSDDPRLPVPVPPSSSIWPRLGHSGAEAEAILAVAAGEGNRLELGFDASRETLEQGDWSRFSVLHFATHAENHAEHPEVSGLVLSLFDRQGSPREGFLLGSEISRLRLDADLVVLSACETGVGKDQAGEGMASLARFFFEAGARSVVSSLWPVSDRSTAELMARLYRAYLGDGLSPAAALARAQRELLSRTETSAPYRWAGFVAQGDAWDSP